MIQALSALVGDESAQDLAEYAILLALIALAVVLSVALLGQRISETFNDIGTSMTVD